jgi:tRNA (guanine37-N1)-methyltransferase
MRFDVVTLFPELITAYVGCGVIRRAFEPTADGGPARIDLRLHNPRAQTQDRHQSVDDRPYGGGPGMVMLAEPLAATLDLVLAERRAAGQQPRVVGFGPGGRPIEQRVVERLAADGGAVLLCGRYEGIDQRLLDAYVDEEFSLGDFVVSGGELAALALLDAVARRLPGVLNDPQSALQESFAGEALLLEAPHYTRPERWRNGAQVPAVLLSGDHGAIARWRREQSLARTLRLRPELIERARRAGQLGAADEAFLARCAEL